MTESLAKMTHIDVRNYFEKRNIALLPIGSTEQHGKHLPLGTDHLIAEALANQVSLKTGTLLFPTIPYGVSKHHRHFPTAWISSQLFRELVTQVALSFKPYGLRKLVLVNGHGGNTTALGEVAEDLSDENIHCIVWEWWKTKVIEGFLQKEVGPDLGTVTHADLGETSMAIAHFEEWVQMDRAEDHPTTIWAPRIHGAMVHFFTNDFTESGNLGAPTKASRKLGDDLRALAIQELEFALAWLDAI